MYVDCILHSVIQLTFSEHVLCIEHSRTGSPFPIKGKRNKARYHQGGAYTHPTSLHFFCTFIPVFLGNHVSSQTVSWDCEKKPLSIITTDSGLLESEVVHAMVRLTLCSLRACVQLPAVPPSSWVSCLTALCLSPFICKMEIRIVPLHGIVRSKCWCS